MYYCQQEHGYWSGTLIRIRTITGAERTNDDEESYEMKIYNRYDLKNSNIKISLIHLLIFVFRLQGSNQNKESV